MITTAEPLAHKTLTVEAEADEHPRRHAGRTLPSPVHSLTGHDLTGQGVPLADHMVRYVSVASGFLTELRGMPPPGSPR
jgi:hypothetical protein